MRGKYNFVSYSLILLLIALWGCGPKPIKQESIMDTSRNHYKQGMRKYEQGNLEAALEEFNRAKALDPKYALAFSGIGLVHAAKGDFKQALENVNKALDLDDKSIESMVAKARIITKQRKGDDWLKISVKLYNKALEIDPQSDMVHYYLGNTYKNAYKFSEASDAYKKVIEIKGAYAKMANEEWEIVQKIERAAPGTEVGSKIALIKEIGRADLAVLLLEELKLAEVLDKRRKKTYDTDFKEPENPQEYKESAKSDEPAATDISDHWAKNWIKDIIEIDVSGLEPFADHTFKPNDLITRANYALVIQNVLILVSNDNSIATKYFGEESHFLDVRSDHFAYNAIALCTERGIMKANLDGSFGIDKRVSGADALLTIRKLQDALRMDF